MLFSLTLLSTAIAIPHQDAVGGPAGRSYQADALMPQFPGQDGNILAQATSSTNPPSPADNIYVDQLGPGSDRSGGAIPLQR